MTVAWKMEYGIQEGKNGCSGDDAEHTGRDCRSGGMWKGLGLMAAQAAPVRKQETPGASSGLVWRQAPRPPAGDALGTCWDQQAPEQMLSVRDDRSGNH